MDRRRRLFWHGIFLFLLGLVAGAFVQRMTNPRMGLSAHLGGVMTGTFLAVLGALWPELRLSPRAESAAYRLALFGTYGSSASLLLAAILGTSSMTPIAGAGHTAAGWQEAIVTWASSRPRPASSSAACSCSGASAGVASGGCMRPMRSRAALTQGSIFA